MFVVICSDLYLVLHGRGHVCRVSEIREAKYEVN